MDEPMDFFSAVNSLAAIEELDVEAMRLLFRVECSGEDFYEQLAERIGDARAADLLRRNAREERGHAQRLRGAITIKLGREFEPSAKEMERFPVHLPERIPPELLPMIVQGEFDGDSGYQRWADRESDPEVQRLLRLNGREEARHAERVRDVIAILTGRPSN